MPKFDSSTIGGSLDFDFTGWGGSKGTVPEPSRPAVNKLLKKVQNSFKDLGLVDENSGDSTTPDQVRATMDKIEDEALFEKMTEAMTAAVADVCGGTPSLEELTALPYRPFMGFFGFLMGNLVDPEGLRSGTSNSPRRLTSA